MKQIYHLRLTNNDEIFGYLLDSENVLTLRVGEPLCTSEIEDDEGNLSIGLMDYLPFSENGYCDIQKSHIITCTAVHPDISEFYQLSKHFTDKSSNDMMDKIRYTTMRMNDIINEDNLVDNEYIFEHQSSMVH